MPCFSCKSPAKKPALPSRSDCECDGAGFCRRHQCHKTQHFWRLCQRPEWFARWEDGKGPCLYGPVPKRGFGDWLALLIKTATLGFVKPCRACNSRRNRLNRWWRRLWQRRATLVSGVTTCSWRSQYLDATLASVRASGFEPTVFTDDGRGAFGNWLGALSSLGETKCHYVALFQDDVICCRGLTSFLERLEWPSDAGCLSLYSPGKRAPDGPSGVIAHRHGTWWGACALVFPVDVARQIPAHALVGDWRHDRQIDKFVGRVVEALGKTLYHVVPSLVQHVGDESAFGDGRKMGSHRRAADFVGEHFDARDRERLAQA